MFYVSVVSDCFINSAAYVSSRIYLLLPPTSLCGPGQVIHPPGWWEGPQRSSIQAFHSIYKDHSNNPDHPQAGGRPVHRQPPVITVPGVPASYSCPSCTNSGLGRVTRFGQREVSNHEQGEALQVPALWGFLSWSTPS